MKIYRICCSDIENHLQNIITNWYDFVNNHSPIVELFYQVLIENSTYINKLLNLTQALEVFSHNFRDKNNLQIIKKKIKIENYVVKHEKSSSVTLFHKIYDLLDHAKDFFGLDDVQAENISCAISNARNYYTHYTKDKSKIISQEEVLLIGRFLTYFLRLLIIEKIGVPMAVIKQKLYDRECNEIVELIKKYK